MTSSDEQHEMVQLRSSGDGIKEYTRMHGFTSYRLFEKARLLRNDQNMHVLGHYVVTNLGSELGRYVATEQSLARDRSLRSDRAPARVRSLRSDRAFARSLRSDRAEWTFGRYVATEPWLKLGRYVATEWSTCSVAA